MTLEFLQISKYSFKHDFFIHIKELIQVPVKVGSDYEMLFANLRNEVANREEAVKQAIEDFIKFNEDQFGDDVRKKEMLETVVTLNSNQYAVFNLKS